MIGKILLRHFIAGLVILSPIFITGAVIYRLVAWADELVGIPLPGINILVVLVMVTMIGLLANVFITRPIFTWADKTIQRIPIINLLYKSVRDITDAFVGDKKKFTIPVAVRISSTGMLKLGFITGDPSSIIDDKEIGEYEAVCFPHSYNFSGNLFVVPKKDISRINMKSADVMKYIVTGGAIDIKASNSAESEDIN